MKLGILGGTFNPPHLGHLLLGQEAYVALDLDEVVLIPAGDPPHKPDDEEPGAEHRLALCHAAVQGDPKLSVSNIESRRPGPSFTADTLRELSAQAPDTELHLILGGDAAAGLPRWREPEQIVSHARLAVAERAGAGRQAIEEALRSIPARVSISFFAMPAMDVSSTLVRKRVREGLPLRYLVPDLVTDYIRQHGLYRGAEPA